ncbi:MAG: hypothetical protein CMD26_06175 [Flavobacteriales bacterium]|nr:hypothetical protein [Flavobacteriales bacterium]
MNKNIKLTPLHCIFYVYHTFAFGSDGKLNQDEKKIISSFMFRWVGQDKEKMSQVISETLNWSKENIDNINNQIGTMISMVEFLKSQSSFDTFKREYFLMDIRNIARSDGNFIDQQKKWHDMLANILELNIRISQSSLEDINGAVKKVEKRKIGFRR